MSYFSAFDKSLKPIETEYNGYKFRSRLEARWAIFFDTLEVRYEYEPQGYDLGEHGWYLPDFVLLECEIFVEIKPNGNWPYNPKYQMLAEGSQRKCLFISGNPWPNEYDIRVYSAEPEFRDYGGRDAFQFGWERKDEKLWVMNEDTLGYYFSIQPTTERAKLPIENHSRLLEAYKAARQARFEHGEKP